MPLYILIFLLYQISPANADTQCGNLCNKNWWKQNNLILLQKELSLAEIDLTSNLDENAPIYFASAYGSPEMLKYLIENGIQAYIGYVPLHSSIFSKNKGLYEDLEVTDFVGERILRLPLHTNLKSKDIDYICKNIKNYYKTKE